MHIAVEDLHFAFPRTGDLYSGLSFELRAPAVAAVVGPSGSGKSTLLSIIAGWTKPQRGRVERVGISKVIWVLQNPHGQPRRTARDHVMQPLLAAGSTIAQAGRRADELLDGVGLAHVADSRYSQLSGGEAGRLMLVRAMAAAPDLLLVDEPTAQLDRAAAAEVNGVLHQFTQLGTIVMIATHDEQTREKCPVVLDVGAHTLAQAGS